MKLYFYKSSFWKGFITQINTIPHWILYISVSILPALITCAIIYLRFGAKLSDFRPYNWNDQTGYWIWVRSFSKYGFNVGYNVGNELPAPASFNHYGEGSPLYIYLYGSVGRMVGWYPQLPIILNFFLLAITIYWFTRVTKLDSFQILITGLVVIFFWPILLYLPTSSHETLNQTIGIILAGIFYVLISRERKVTLFQKLVFVVILSIASLIRLSWALFFFPLIILCWGCNSPWKIVRCLLLGAILLLGSVLVTRYLVPPFGNSIFSTLKQTFENGPQVLWGYFGDEIKQLTEYRNYASQVVVLELLIVLGWSIARIWKLLRGGSASGDDLLTQSIFNIYSVSSILIGGMFLYLVPGFFRVFVPPLLVVVMLQIAQRDFKPVLVLLGINIICLLPLMNFFYGSWEVNFRPINPQIVQSQKAITENVVYDINTDNPWCNTLVLPLDNYDYRVTIIPAGIGVSHLSNWPPLPIYPLKSKYLLFDRNSYQLIRDKLNVKLLASMPIGDLYYNLDSGCGLK